MAFRQNSRTFLALPPLGALAWWHAWRRLVAKVGTSNSDRTISLRLQCVVKKHNSVQNARSEYTLYTTLPNLQYTNAFGRSEAFPLSTSNRSIKTKTDMEHRWNNNDGGKLEPSVKNRRQRHFIREKSHTDWSGIESGLRSDRPATTRLSQHNVLNTKFNLNYT